MIQQMLLALDDYRLAFRLVGRLRLWWYFVLPAFLSVCIAALLFLLIRWQGAALGEWIVGWFPFDLDQSSFAVVGQWIGFILLGFVGLLLFKYILIIVLSPFLGPLSEKVEHYLLPEQPASGWSPVRFLSDLVRGLRINLRNMFREIIFTLMLIVIGFIPVIGFIAAFLIIIVQSYYAGFGNMDFTLERYFNTRESVRFVRQKRALAIGHGLIFLFMLMIPVLGILIGPPLAVIAATVGTVRNLKSHPS